MNSVDYWKIRNAQALKAIEKDEAKLMRRLGKFYKTENVKLKRDIGAFYQQYGEKGIIQFRQLLERLDDPEKNLLYRDYSAYCASHPGLAHLEEVRNNIYKLNRLEGLQASVQLQMAKIGDTENEEVTEHLKAVGRESWEAVSDYLGNKISPEIAEKYIGTEWSNGKNFSGRIWDNQDKIAGIVNNELAQGFARGDNYRSLVKQIGEKFEGMENRNIYRLVYTEGTYVYNETAAGTFENDGFEEYQISTAEDKRVCSVCKSLEGESFRFSDRMPGTNFPPLHPLCRCTFTVTVKR